MPSTSKPFVPQSVADLSGAEGAKNPVSSTANAATPKGTGKASGIFSKLKDALLTLPFLSMQGARAVVTNPYVLGAAAAAAIAAAAYKTYTGSLDDALGVDITQAIEEVNELLAPGGGLLSDHPQFSSHSKEQLKIVRDTLKQIQMQHGAIKPSSSSEQIAEAVANIAALIDKANATFIAFQRDAASGFVRKTLGFGFPSLENALESVTNGIDDFTNSFPSEVKSLMAKHQQDTKSTEKAVPEPERIAGIQEFLNEYMKANLVVNGDLDRGTIQAIERFSNEITTSLGVTNFTASRIESEGSAATLRAVYDVYKNRHFITNKHLNP